jgi:hypothetical protein
MRRTIWASIVVLAACVEQRPPEREIEIRGIASSERETRDIFIDATAITIAGTTSISVTFRDRLQADELVRLVDGESLIARAGTSVYPLTEELVELYPWLFEPRYIVTFADADPRAIDLELARSDGSVAYSSFIVPAAYELQSALPRNIKIGDIFDVAITSSGSERTGFINWACDSSTRAHHAA